MIEITGFTLWAKPFPMSHSFSLQEQWTDGVARWLVYETYFSQALHTCLRKLRSETLPAEGRIEIDGIIGINVANTDKLIVLKVHDIMDKSRASSLTFQSDAVLMIDMYKNDSATAMMVKASQIQEKVVPSPPSPPDKRPDVLPDRQLNSRGIGSRRKQVKPQRLIQVPDDYQEETAMSVGKDLDIWYPESDSGAEDMSLKPASMELIPNDQDQRPPRQWVPLKDVLHDAVGTPSDFAHGKCNVRFPGFERLQVHNMKLHQRLVHISKPFRHLT